MLDTKMLGENIKELRRGRGLTQQTFADIMGVSFQAVSNWERGIAPPDLENTLRIAAYFGVSVDSLFRHRGEDLYLGIDGGGTKTELAVVSASGYVLKRTVKKGCNPNDIGYGKTLELLTNSIGDILAEFPSVKAAFLGIAGSSSGDYAKRLEADLKKCYPATSFTIKSDAYNLFAMDEGADMALISGTGSVVFVKDKDGYKRLGGYGYLIDDAGSAFGIGKDALRLALKEEDMKAKRSLLSSSLLKKLNTATVWEAVNAVYAEGRPFIASLSSAVFDAYTGGDDGAKMIIDSNAKALAELINAGVELYGARPVAIVSGGLFEHHRDIMLEHIGKYSKVALVAVELPPIFGACRMACKSGDAEISGDFYDNFKRTYGGRE